MPRTKPTRLNSHPPIPPLLFILLQHEISLVTSMKFSHRRILFANAFEKVQHCFAMPRQLHFRGQIDVHIHVVGQRTIESHRQVLLNCSINYTSTPNKTEYMPPAIMVSKSTVTHLSQKNQSSDCDPAISAMNSRLLLNFANCLVSCSIASTWCIDESVLLNMLTECNVSGSSNFSSRRVPD